MPILRMMTKDIEYGLMGVWAFACSHFLWLPGLISGKRGGLQDRILANRSRKFPDWTIYLYFAFPGHP